MWISESQLDPREQLVGTSNHSSKQPACLTLALNYLMQNYSLQLLPWSPIDAVLKHGNIELFLHLHKYWPISACAAVSVVYRLCVFVCVV